MERLVVLSRREVITVADLPEQCVGAYQPHRTIRMTTLWTKVALPCRIERD